MTLFPKQRIFNQVAQANQASTVSTFFLENLLRARPDDADLRLLLAHHYLEVGQITQAQTTLTQLLDSTQDDVWLKARLLALRLQKIRTLALPEGSLQRQNGMGQLRDQIHVMISSGHSLQTKVLTQLAQSAQLIGEPELAQMLYERLGTQSEPQSSAWFAKAAGLALERSAYKQAASLYFSALRYAQTQQEKKAYYMAALKVLQAGNFLAEAIQQAQTHLEDVNQDEEILLFLIALGRAAGNGAFAQKYVKDLLRIAFVPTTGHVIPTRYEPKSQEATHSWIFAPTASNMHMDSRTERWRTTYGRREYRWLTNSQPSHQHPALRPFDDRIYSLAYTVFLENQNLQDAFALAQAAVQQAPQRLTWRKRLAQVAEWTGRQDVALAQWRFMAERNPSIASFEQILRLAPGAWNDAQVIFSLLGLGKIRSLSDEEWHRLIDAFEREGQPKQAIAYLTHLNQQSPARPLLEAIAVLYRRMGKNDQAYESYRILENLYGKNIRWAMEQANLLVRRGDLRGAYDVLRQDMSLAQPNDLDFWKLLGHVAWTLEEDQQAEDAYRQLWTHRELSATGQERLILLARQSRPFEAIDIGLAGWRNTHSPRFLLQALDLLLQEKKHQEIQAILNGLLPWEEKLVAQNERYWVIRAEVMAKMGQPEEGLHAYQRALALNPESSEIKEAFLWFLIDQNDRVELELSVNDWRDMAEQDPRLWGAMAAAYMVLDRPKPALPYFVRQLKHNQHDYLWLLNYASALEASSYTALAWKVRQHAWLGVRQRLLTTPPEEHAPHMREAYAMLANVKDPGDALLELFRQEDIHRTSRTSPVMKELVLSWLLSQEAFDAAKMWLWKNYARRMTAPGWAELAIALEDNDWESIHAIVTRHTKTLSRSDNIEAASRLDRLTLAQTLAFDSMSRDPDNTVAHVQYQEAIKFAVDQITSRIMFEDRRPLSSYAWKTAIPIQLGRMEVRPEASVTWQTSTDASAFSGVPHVDRQIGASVGYRRPSMFLRLTGFQRSAVSNFWGVGMMYEQAWNDHFSSILTLGRNYKADDSIALQVGGVKDFIRGQGLYYFSKRQFVSLQLDAPWFFTQSRDALGHALGVEGALGHHLRREYPDVTVRVTGNVRRYWRVNTLPASIRPIFPGNQPLTSDLVVPREFSQLGINLSFGDSIRDVYTKGIRPFGLLGANHNSTNGFGYSVEAGMAARLLGQDRLVLFGSHIRGGFGQNAKTTQMNLEYQRWF